MTKFVASLLVSALLAAALSGCATNTPAGAQAASQPALTPDQQEASSQKEASILSGITQLTFSRDFEKAGEAYFSRDMRWVVFQAVPRPQPGQPVETNYQMYVARLVYVNDQPSGLVVTTRLTPPGSRNTCGWFSPDGQTLIFGSTAGKDDPDEASPGYQRSGSRYRWAFSKGMEIYRVTDWEKKVRTASAGGYINLATPENRLTNNDSYDAECAISPDGDWLVFCSDRPSPSSSPGSPDLRLRVADDLLGLRAATENLLITPATTQPETPQASPPTATPAPAPKQLWAMRLDGTDLVQLTDTPGYNGGPFFSPDGKRLLYRSDRKGNDLLQILVADIVWQGGWGKPRKIVGLTNERPITNDANVNWAPYWAPGYGGPGDRIVYATSAISHGNYEIFSRRDDGSRPTRLTYAPGPDVLPVISPTGQHLLWAAKRGQEQTTQIYIAQVRFPKGS